MEGQITQALKTPIQIPVINEVDAELRRAMGKHAPMNSAHEAYAVILEEVQEFWAEVMKKRELRSKAAMKTELLQISAMACRAIIDLRLDEETSETK